MDTDVDYSKLLFFFVVGLALGPLFFYGSVSLLMKWKLWRGRRRNRKEVG